MVKELELMTMVNMKVNFKMVLKTETGHLNGLMVINIQDNGKIMRETVMEFLHLKMGTFMMGSF